MTSAKKGCWTCKDRKVLCDRTVPACIKCSKSKRACGGYGLRLSWPQEHDTKRTHLETTDLQEKQVTRQQQPVQWVNVCLTDLRLHLLATTSDGKARGRIRLEHLVIPNIIEPLPTMRITAAAGDMELLRYFESTVSNILPMLGSDRTRIRRILVEMALSNRTRASRAVLLSLLALASYHRGDDLVFAAQMKHSALEELLDATGPEMDASTGIEHIAAGTILCIVEIQQTSDTECGWVGHICGVKEVIQAIQQTEHPLGGDASAILGWVYYFDTLARFSVRHWRTESIKSTAQELGFNSNGMEGCALQYIIARTSFSRAIPTLPAHAHPLTRLLAGVFDTILYSSDPHYHTAEYQQSLNELRSRLESISIISPDEEISKEETASLELTRLAALVYLERVSRNFSGQSAQLGLWIKAAQPILTSLDTCLSPFPLFIFGCEAHTDEDRMTLLNLFARIARTPHMNSVFEAKGLIQSAWVQHDLAVDRELEYIYKLNLVMSSRNIIPSLM